LPKDPAQLLIILGCSRPVADLALRIVFIGQIEQDGAAVEDALLAVGQGGDLPVRVDLEEPSAELVSVADDIRTGMSSALFLLLAGLDGELLELIGETELLEDNGDLVPIRGIVGVEGDVGGAHFDGLD
jgi:hypothetical protein